VGNIMNELSRLRLSAPLAEILVQMARAVVKSQEEMDTYSLEIHRNLEDVKDELNTALSAPWFHIPEVEIDVHLAFEYQEKRATNTQPGFRRLDAAFINSAYQNLFQFDGSAASRLKVSFRAVPAQI